MKEDVEDIAFVLKVLADPIRIGILKALNTDDLCVCVFVEVTNQNIRHYLTIWNYLKMRNWWIIESKVNF